MPRYHSFILSFCSAAALAGCGASSTSEAPTQVAAKINGDEITLLQIEQSLRGVAVASPEQAGLLRAQALETLIDQTLLTQKAKETKLDRDPQVVAAMEAARHRILAQAYANQVAGKVAKPTEVDVKAFFEKHPELFSERRIYQVDELAVPANAVSVDELKKVVEKANTTSEVAKWLTSKNVRFGTNRGAQAAEGLPMEVARQLNRLREGDMTVLELPNAIQVVHLLKVQTAAVSFKQAQPAVERYLQNERQREAVLRELASLRGSMQGEYKGEFAKAKSSPSASPGVPPGAPAAETKAASPAVNPAVERGVSMVR